MHITVIGAGAWGTAMAMAACRHPGQQVVRLHARDASQAAAMQAQRQNLRYLPGVELPENLSVLTGSVDDLVSGQPQDLWVLATPMSGLRSNLQRLQQVQAPVAWLCKGFEADTGLMPHEVQAQAAPGLQAGALSGPSFALEVARQQPTALVAASAHAAVRDTLVKAFHGPALRVYANEDIVGVEVGGAVKNVLAIATGLCDGLNLGLNARAALITRGLAEMTRLGLALGAKAETFMGLSGLGDLVLTATGDLSRNRKVGLLLAQGLSLEQAVDSLGHVAEGVYSARTVWQRAQSLGVDMPITEAVVALLDGRLQAREAVLVLMGRGPRGESV
jgi:glycerol-3-phosphate dehydrogenase (NAD(P)+)